MSTNTSNCNPFKVAYHLVTKAPLKQNLNLTKLQLKGLFLKYYKIQSKRGIVFYLSHWHMVKKLKFAQLQSFEQNVEILFLLFRKIFQRASLAPCS